MSEGLSLSREQNPSIKNAIRVINYPQFLLTNLLVKQVLTTYFKLFWVKNLKLFIKEKKNYLKHQKRKYYFFLFQGKSAVLNEEMTKDAFT